MQMKTWKSLNSTFKYFLGEAEEEAHEEEEEGGEYLFDPEAGKASDDPFAHLKLEDAPSDEAVSDEEVSKYVTGE